MKKHSKTLIGSIAAFFMGTSCCCWMSSLAIWVGGFASIGTFVTLVEDLQIVLIGLSIVLLIAALYQYYRVRRGRLFSGKN